VLLLITTRLGLTGIDQDFHEPLRAIFDLPQCVGLLGGKPNFALYFVGYTHNPIVQTSS
jgi:cysteine protease ATG4